MKTIQYTTTLYPFRKKTVLVQLSIAIGIPFSILILFLIIIQAKEAMILVALLLILSFILITILYRKMEVQFTIDSFGVRSEPSPRQLKKNTRMNILTILSGIFTKNPTVTSSGLLSQSNQIQYFKWDQIISIKQNDLSFILTNKQRQKLVLITTKENNDDIYETLNYWGKGKIL